MSLLLSDQLFTDDTLWQSYCSHRQVVIVTNKTIAQYYLKPLQQLLSRITDVSTIIISDGERYKTLQTFDQIITELLKQNIHRNALMIALGGGVIGDIVGFVAATYQRGVDFIQVPTTLLAMVDASIGGKTAINHALGKNMIGAFYPPQAIMTDPSVLDTLPERQFNVGLAEVMKTALVADAAFFEWLLDHTQAIMDHASMCLRELIQRCADIKSNIVAQDAQDHGIRQTLNYGHTFAHAIEQVQGYGRLLHGEAVSIGMCLALQLSMKRGMISQETYQAIKHWLLQFGLPTQLPSDFTVAHLLPLMQRDKKNQNQQIRIVLLTQIGKAKTCDYTPDELIAELC